MNWISIFFFLIAFLICYSMLRKNTDVLSPARVFGITWSLVFGLANLKLSRLQFEWTFIQWISALMGPISFLIGLYFTYVFNMGARLLPIYEIRQKVREQKINDKRLFYLTIFSFIIYLIGFIAVYSIKGQIPLFSFNPSATRTEFTFFGIGLFIHNVSVVIIFSIIYHLFTKKNNNRKLIIKIIAFITIITYLSLLQRYALMMTAFISFAYLYYTSRSISFKSMAVFISTGILVIYTVATLRAGKIIQLALYKTSQMKYSSSYAIFTEPYMYIVMNIENFVHAVNKLEQHTYGYFTFNYVLALTGMKHWVEEYYSINETPFLFSGYNTYTLFWAFYRDFGVFGLTFIPMALGLFVGSVYYSLRRDPTIEYVAFYSIIVFVMGMSFFINLLGFLWFVYIIAWIVIILRSIRLKTP